LSTIVDAPWYVPKTVIRKDLKTPTLKEEIRIYISQYSSRNSAHPHDLIVNLMELPKTGAYEDTCQMLCMPDS
jgi:hypothetical protein